MNIFRAQLDAFFQLISSPVGLFAFIGLVVSMALMVFIRPAKWPVFTLLLFMATLSYRVVNNVFTVELVFPLEQIRAQCRGVCIALLIALLVPLVMQFHSWRTRWFAGAALAYFVFQMMLAMRMFADGAFDPVQISFVT